MNLIQINNLRDLINLQYPHICLHTDDLTQFLNIPWEAKRFYPFKTKDSSLYYKKGFFHNGKTTVWAVSADVPRNHIKIADKTIPMSATGKGWSMIFPFEEEGSADRIKRMMQMKAFW